MGDYQQTNYKIGISCEPKKRLSSLQSGCPFPLKIFKTYLLNDNASNVEKKIHQYLENNKQVKSLMGEWFSCDINIIEMFMTRELEQIKKEKLIKELHEREIIQKEKRKLEKQKEEINKEMQVVLNLQNELDEKFKKLRLIEQDILQLSNDFEQAKKSLDKHIKNREIKKCYKDIINDNLKKIRHFNNRIELPEKYHPYYNNTLSFFKLFGKKKIYGLNKRNRYYTFDDDILTHREDRDVKENYLDISRYNQFLLICKNKNYTSYDTVHFDKDSNYYLVNFQSGNYLQDRIYLCDEFGFYENEGVFEKFKQNIAHEKT